MEQGRAWKLARVEQDRARGRGRSKRGPARGQENSGAGGELIVQSNIRHKLSANFLVQCLRQWWVHCIHPVLVLAYQELIVKLSWDDRAFG